ncbi:MAG: hypothetical protein WC523_00445 [Patescibacteria group bacterium]
MIAIVVRDLPYLKLLSPIMTELQARHVGYILYYMDCGKQEKEYNRPSLSRITKSSELNVIGAKNIRRFTNDKELRRLMAADHITKMVSVEIWMWARKYLDSLKSLNIKTYSISYLTDSLWQTKQACVNSIYRTYNSTKFLMETKHNFLGLFSENPYSRYIGSPLFDCIKEGPSNGTETLVLLPNIRPEHVGVCFGKPKNFINIIAKIASNDKIIIKTRKKQWMPTEIKEFAKEVIEDGDIMYPTKISSLLDRCCTTVMFYSSGIYESVCGGNYVLNIPLPLGRWKWQKDMLIKYFSTADNSLYNFNGVVETISPATILSSKWAFEKKCIDRAQRESWMNKYIGAHYNGTESIVNDILLS